MIELKTAEQVLALPIAHVFDEKYRYIGAAPISGDMIGMCQDKDGVCWRPESRRETRDGSDVWVRIRAGL